MTLLAAILNIGGKMAEQQGKRKGGDPEFIGVSAFRSIICIISCRFFYKNTISTFKTVEIISAKVTTQSFYK